MTSIKIPREIRAKTHKVFPNESPHVSQLDFAALAGYASRVARDRDIQQIARRFERVATTQSTIGSTQLVQDTSSCALH